jgi:hypothetical protein
MVFEMYHAAGPINPPICLRFIFFEVAIFFVAESYVCCFHNVQKALFEEDYEKDAESSKHVMSDFDESMRSLETSSRGQAKSDDETCFTFPRCRQISV